MFLPGESQGQGSLVGCRLWGRTESDMTEAIEQQQQQVVYIGRKKTKEAFLQNPEGKLFSSYNATSNLSFK